MRARTTGPLGMRAAFLITSPGVAVKAVKSAPATRRTSWETGKGARRREKKRGGVEAEAAGAPSFSFFGSVSRFLVTVMSLHGGYLISPHRPVRCVSCKVEAIHFLKRPNYLTPWHGHQRAVASNSPWAGICGACTRYIRGRECARNVRGLSCRDARGPDARKSIKESGVSREYYFSFGGKSRDRSVLPLEAVGYHVRERNRVEIRIRSIRSNRLGAPIGKILRASGISAARE